MKTQSTPCLQIYPALLALCIWFEGREAERENTAIVLDAVIEERRTKSRTQ